MGLNQIVLLAEQIENKPVGERLSTALTNSAMIVIIVFSVLLIICVFISSFILINKYENRRNGSEPKNTTPHVDAIMGQIASIEEEELVDDLELVAVITAAIQAYEAACGNEVSANGLHVRSIKKVNTNWRNAL